MGQAATGLAALASPYPCPRRAWLRTRARRYAAVQEQLVAPDDWFAAFGRSLVYRCGAFQHLARCCLQNLLPPELPAGRGRPSRPLSGARWRPRARSPRKVGSRLGVRHQPSIGEEYISTGSLYLCTTAFLPLGLLSTPFLAGVAQKGCREQDIKTDHVL